MKLWKGIKVIVWKMGCAGGYSVHYVNMLGSRAEVELSSGEPFECAFREAELLAVVIDAEFILKEGIEETVIRKSIGGEYKDFSKKEV